MIRVAAALLAGLLGLAACSAPPPAPRAAGDVDWPFYGGDAGGQRFSRARQITPSNVRGLKVAWTYSTGDMASKGKAMEHASFEATPILAGGRLYLCSAFNAVSALDPATGKP
ncbi:MAG: gcd, partial [Phenylobacterium sp.]|nr:gcd [Phenylobacterium sp.]